ncbi:DALR anticodon-binding domain-containing protein 3 [Musca autumnalis]|uniref:DALR anticodon-binding domain-containing protein 3 n=1 Tax=Musca autumnalis TaxID=221902 RepID=UPI003CF4B6EF
MENPYHTLITNVTKHFVKTAENYEALECCRASTLIRIHNDKLVANGEVSFPLKPEIWENYFPTVKGFKVNTEALDMLNGSEDSDQSNDLITAAKSWTYPVANLNINHERCHLHLCRPAIIKLLMQQVLSDPLYGHLRKNANCHVELRPLQEYGLKTDDLSFYRAKLMYETLQKLLCYSRWHIVGNETSQKIDENSILKLNILSVASKVGVENVVGDANVNIKCGLVTDPSTKGKICQLPAQEYISLRSNDMCLMALHKYGVRVKQDARFCALMERLGTAAVTVDLLEVKHTSPVQIIRNGQGSTKGASFLLYNSARLESLLRTFEERIERRSYEPTPEISDIDWNLLNEEEEWQLVFAYLAGFPDLIDRCLEQLERGMCATHLIIRFLHGLVAIFSVYYRRIRILTEKRDQLMPYVYARIYLIRAVREILNKTLALLDIQPVEFM